MDAVRAALADAPAALTPVLELASQPFVGRWNQLVSTTNWEKGRIICQWREALIAADAPAAEYADDAWSRLVGGVTGQHVGRLRRVYQRFGDSFKKYRGLFWSHFQAATEWNDAEMWLEGAVQSKWSVSEMRRTRWQTLGGGEDTRPRDAEIVISETDEDFSRADDAGDSPDKNSSPGAITGKLADVHAGPRHDGPDFGDEAAPGGSDAHHRTATADNGAGKEPNAVIRPFENLPELPDDLAEAFDTFKLAILHHKTEGWKKVSCDAVLESLNALKALALAPSDSAAPF